MSKKAAPLKLSKRTRKLMEERVAEIRQDPSYVPPRFRDLKPGRPSTPVFSGGAEVIPWEETVSPTPFRDNLSPEQRAFIARRQAKRLRREQLEARAAFAEMRASLQPVKRTTPQQRFEALVDGLIQEAKKSYIMTGRVNLPPSIVNSIVSFYASRGVFSMTPEKIQAMAMDEINRVLRAYARNKQETVERQSTYRREMDAHLKPHIGREDANTGRSNSNSGKPGPASLKPLPGKS
jgi:hypothetical protein